MTEVDEKEISEVSSKIDVQAMIEFLQTFPPTAAIEGWVALENGTCVAADIGMHCNTDREEPYVAIVAKARTLGSASGPDELLAKLRLVEEHADFLANTTVCKMSMKADQVICEDCSYNSNEGEDV